MVHLAIKACGMVTSVGFNAPASLAAIRAGIRNVKETNLWDPESGTYLAAGRVPLPQWGLGIGKLADLVAPAILECLQAATPTRPQEVPVLLGVASHDRPFRLRELDHEILAEIEHRLGFALHPASRVIPRDRASITHALRDASDLIDRQEAHCAVVAAVDSLLQHNLKDYYLSKRRLLTPNSSNGFSLGEAGSALLVAPEEGNGVGQLRIRGLGQASEMSTIESEEPLRGDGLVQSIQEAFRNGGVGYDDLHYRIADLNGEHYKFKEMVLAMMRLARKPKPKLFDLWHPIECIGDVGSAIGPIVLGVALHAARMEYAVGPMVLCTFGNDNGERTALILEYV